MLPQLLVLSGLSRIHPIRQHGFLFLTGLTDRPFPPFPTFFAIRCHQHRLYGGLHHKCPALHPRDLWVHLAKTGTSSQGLRKGAFAELTKKRLPQPLPHRPPRSPPQADKPKPDDFKRIRQLRRSFSKPFTPSPLSSPSFSLLAALMYS